MDAHSSDRKPTPGQMSYLKDLAVKAGQSFAYPRTFAEASAAIRRLEKVKPTGPAERLREVGQLRREMAEACGDGARVRGEEIRGWGASAGW